MTYNKDIFKDVGLDPEIPPKTMTEYLDFAKKITAAGKQAVYGNTSCTCSRNGVPSASRS